MILFFTSMLALTQAATLVPTDSSSVNVKQSGNEFSYSIQQSHGVAAGPSPDFRQGPTAKSTQTLASGSNDNVQIGSQQNQDQIPQQQQIQGRLLEETKTDPNKKEPLNLIYYPVLPTEKPLPQQPPKLIYILPYPVEYPQQVVQIL